MINFKSYIQPLLLGYNKHYSKPGQRLALVVGMQPWKKLVGEWVLEPSHIQIQRHFSKTYFILWLKPFIKHVNPVIYIWGYKAPDFFIDYIRAQHIEVFFLEDGFIRSAPDDKKGDGPLSIVLDSQAPYFDTTRPNDLTDLIANFDFQQKGYNEVLVQEMLDYYVAHRVSKYNYQSYIDITAIYGTKNKKRILVLGQVPHDHSLKYGGGLGITLVQMVKTAIEENPGAQIIAKPHPMTFDDYFLVRALIKLDCVVLAYPIHLVDALNTVDHVYTVTSLGGFEALLRGKIVTVLGQPFYNLSILTPVQLFYIAAIYHKYL